MNNLNPYINISYIVLRFILVENIYIIINNLYILKKRFCLENILDIFVILRISIFKNKNIYIKFLFYQITIYNY